jgi:hypothetical protein
MSAYVKVTIRYANSNTVKEEYATMPWAERRLAENEAATINPLALCSYPERYTWTAEVIEY